MILHPPKLPEVTLVVFAWKISASPSSILPTRSTNTRPCESGSCMVLVAAPAVLVSATARTQGTEALSVSPSPSKSANLNCPPQTNPRRSVERHGANLNAVQLVLSCCCRPSQRVGKLRRPCVDDLAAVRCAMKLRTRKLLEWLDRTSPSAGPGDSQCERRSLPSSGWSLWHCRFPADRSMLKTIRGVRKFGTVRETAASLATSNAGRQAAGVIATPCTSRRPGSRGHVAGRACRGKVP
jgi:hypothetical protein